MRTLLTVLISLLVITSSHAEWIQSRFGNGMVNTKNPTLYGGNSRDDSPKTYTDKKGHKYIVVIPPENTNSIICRIDKITSHGFISYKNSNTYSVIMTPTNSLVVGSNFEVMEKDFAKKRNVVKEQVVYVYSPVVPVVTPTNSFRKP